MFAKTSKRSEVLHNVLRTKNFLISSKNVIFLKILILFIIIDVMNFLKMYYYVTSNVIIFIIKLVLYVSLQKIRN